MKKNMIIIDIFTGLIMWMMMHVLSILLSKIGVEIFILIDILGIVLLFFLSNFILHIMYEGTKKTIIINAIIILLIYMLVSMAYERSSVGMETNKIFEMMNELEEMEEEEIVEGVVISFSDGNGLNRILSYGCYFISSFIGGQCGMEIKKRALINRTRSINE